MTKTRKPIPPATQTKILLANRHACCVCQQGGVQLHHIDSDPSNNDPENIAALCLAHHDQATMTAGLTKKITPKQVKTYKTQWEKRCAEDMMALCRTRFTFYYCVYKNPQRIRELLLQLDENVRKAACIRIMHRLKIEQPAKDGDDLWGMNAVPQADDWTQISLGSIHKGEMYPGYLGKFKPHPEDPDYSIDCSSQEAMSAFHLYDLWCQLVVQVLVEAYGAHPLEDLFSYQAEEEFDRFAGGLFSFKLSVRGKGIHIPRMWEEYPTGRITANKKVDGRKYRVRMTLRTMYLFSDTAAMNLEQGRVSGIGILNGAVEGDDGIIELTVTPLLMGYGGWNLYPEGFPASYAATFESTVRHEVETLPAFSSIVAEEPVEE